MTTRPNNLMLDTATKHYDTIAGAFKSYALIKDNMTNLSSGVTPIVGNDGSGSFAGVVIKDNQQPS